MGRPDGKPLNGARVLILEDEFFLADDLAKAVVNAGGIPVGPVSTVEQAEELLITQRPDAAILDLNLRGEMASEFVVRLAATDLPCLIVSGYGEDALPESLRHMPRAEKPITPRSVIETVSLQLARVS